jgi:hypothetical protein
MPRPGDCVRRLGLPGAVAEERPRARLQHPLIGPHHAPSAIDARSECEWKQGHDEASKEVAPLTAALLTDVGLLMEAGEPPALRSLPYAGGDTLT